MLNSDGQRSWETFLERLLVCLSAEEKNKLISTLCHSKQPRIVSFINAHAANLLWNSSGFRNDLLASDFILRDGSGINMLLSMLKVPTGLNLNGTDFIPEILGSYDRDADIAIYGTKGEFLKDGVTSIKRMGFEKIISEDGFHSYEYYIDKFKEYKPNLVILAMGMPKQEKLSVMLRAVARHDVLIINGGAIIDFLSGRVKRAPKWMRKIGIEWLYRLLNDPRRLWKRNMGSVLFILRAIYFSLFCRCHMDNNKSK